MGLTLDVVPVTTTTTTTTAKAADKMIRIGIDALAVMYTCPAGRKFIGQGIISSTSNSSMQIGLGGTGNIYGSTSGGFSFDLYLQAGTTVTGKFSGLSGIESDA